MLESIKNGLAEWQEACDSSWAAQTDPDGSFHLEGIPPGSYQLFASGPVRGYGGRGALLDADPRFGQVRVEVGGQDVEGLTIEVDEGRSTTFLLDAEEPSVQIRNDFCALGVQSSELERPLGRFDF